MTTVFYDPVYAASGFSFPTTRKARWIADSLEANPIPGISLQSPRPLTEEDLLAAHDAEYIQAVRTGRPRGLAQSQGFRWDSGLWPMVLASNGGAVAAALRAMQDGVAGSLSSGLHHARRDRGCGFCTFNGLALAAFAALAAGAEDVIILDLDAHCGGGTNEILSGTQPHIWQVDVSVNRGDQYLPGERGSLDIVSKSEDYLLTIALRLHEMRGLRGLCIYNAGMDPHEDGACGGLDGITDRILQKREEMVFEWCRKQGLPVAFVLAGGYTGQDMDEAKLVELHRLTLTAAT